MTDLIDQFDELFAGRRDAYGALLPDGRYEARREPLTREVWHEHLYGETSVGVYPLKSWWVKQTTLAGFNPTSGEFHNVHQKDRKGFSVKWGCVDIDLGHDLFVIAQNLQKVLQTLGLTSWIEKTKGKGYHVWVFADAWVPASHMRNALLFACGVAGAPTDEVNPKQTELTGDQLGNFVNAPYPMYGIDGRRVVLNPPTHAAYSAQDFADQALASRNSPEAIAKVAAMYKEPHKPSEKVKAKAYNGDLKEVTDKMSGLTYTIFADGPLADSDRSTVLAKLAHKCAADGLTEDETLAALIDADERWGKFAGRDDAETQLMKMVERAY